MHVEQIFIKIKNRWIFLWILWVTVQCIMSKFVCKEKNWYFVFFYFIVINRGIKICQFLFQSSYPKETETSEIECWNCDLWFMLELSFSYLAYCKNSCEFSETIKYIAETKIFSFLRLLKNFCVSWHQQISDICTKTNYY